LPKTAAGSPVVTPPCNSNVLLLSDAQSTFNATLAGALTNAGLTVSQTSQQTSGLKGGDVGYDGTQFSASSFGAILLLNGNDMNLDMPSAGQAQIASAVTGSGVGLVTSENFAWELKHGRYQQLKPFLLIDYGIAYAPAATFTSGTLQFTSAP